ncbi:MAG: hypothetical protein AAF821_17735 [Cyanobacteria bacterium P01_D01_bin.156]
MASTSPCRAAFTSADLITVQILLLALNHTYPQAQEAMLVLTLALVIANE